MSKHLSVDDARPVDEDVPAAIQRVSLFGTAPGKGLGDRGLGGPAWGYAAPCHHAPTGAATYTPISLNLQTDTSTRVRLPPVLPGGPTRT